MICTKSQNYIYNIWSISYLCHTFWSIHYGKHCDFFNIEWLIKLLLPTNIFYCSIFTTISDYYSACFFAILLFPKFIHVSSASSIDEVLTWAGVFVEEKHWNPSVAKPRILVKIAKSRPTNVSMTFFLLFLIKV